nr:immunoglobulin light chain junction region [Macaca mulatta]MOX16722.1 immunoglobulin light chain junction region [Macaca mulatta]MOX16736.1 immunoglobulin light chain junction region [Macaca mulatta]MOX16737.1 immunoglobulin light chain junction region [Macaca mulatta]MOX16738.1 immunoglobulin light chain junction region [Macaca mulatta]
DYYCAIWHSSACWVF